MQLNWDKYEYVFLIEFYVYVYSKKDSSMVCFKNLLENLNSLARARREKFQNNYRTADELIIEFNQLNIIFKSEITYFSVEDSIRTEIVNLYFFNKSSFIELLEKSKLIAKNPKKISFFSPVEVREYFSFWLLSVKELSNSSSKSYPISISSFEKICKAKGWSNYEFYKPVDIENTTNEIKRILGIEEFKIINNKKHSSFSASLNNYIEFLSYFSDSPSDNFMQNLKENEISKELSEKILQTISNSFKSGIQNNSTIAQNVLRRDFSVLFPNESIPQDLNLQSFFQKNGVIFAGIWYLLPQYDKEMLSKLIAEEINNGYKVFYYEKLYSIHQEFLNSISIFSSEVLKLQLANIFENYYFSRLYFSIQNCIKTEQMIQICCDKYSIIPLEEIGITLKYFPSTVIKSFLTQKKSFVRISKGKYISINKIELDELDVLSSKETIKNQINIHGIASLQNIVVEKSLTQNTDLTESALREAIFIKFLSSDYEKRKNTITPKGVVLKIEDILTEFCLSVDEIKISELVLYENQIRTSNTSCALAVAYKTMIRIDKDTFISKDNISFDINIIDSIISLFSKDNIIPVKSVNSFTGFPIFDYSWNSFSLESYCINYSNDYKFLCSSFNDNNIGVIIPRNRHNIAYSDALAEIVVKNKIPIVEKELKQYFVDEFLTSKKINVDDIIIKAQNLINQGG